MSITAGTIVGRVDSKRLGSLARVAVVVGMLAGIVAAAFVTVAGEPAVDAAIAIEEAAAPPPAPAWATQEAGHDEVVVSRGFQKGPGLFGAYAFTGAAFGLLLSVAFFGLRKSAMSSFRRAAVGGGILVGALTVAPWLKYPPNPPAVGNPDTLEHRQFLYLSLIVLSAVVGVAATHLSGRLRRAGWSEHRRVAAVLAVVVTPMLALLAALPPAPDAVGVPATLVWKFRLASLGGSLLLWTVLIVGFGWVLAEADRRRSAPASPVGVAVS